MSVRVTTLWIHPVKSCRAVQVGSLQVDELGVVGDRRFLVTDLAGRMLTQRSHPAMTQIHTALSADLLTLSADGFGSIRVPRQPQGTPLQETGVWGDTGLLAETTGREATEWLSDVLHTPAQLLRIGSAFQRPVQNTTGHRVNFADGFPLLVVSEASLAWLNDRLIASGSDPVPMNRFRPNVVLAGTEPFAEDTWTEFRVGEVRLRGTTQCARCVMTTTDQATGERSAEPLRTLAKYRRDPAKPQDVLFGRNAINLSKHGAIRVGDAVELELEPVVS